MAVEQDITVVVQVVVTIIKIIVIVLVIVAVIVIMITLIMIIVMVVSIVIIVVVVVVAAVVPYAPLIDRGSKCILRGLEGGGGWMGGWEGNYIRFILISLATSHHARGGALLRDMAAWRQRCAQCALEAAQASVETENTLPANRPNCKEFKWGNGRACTPHC